MFLPTALVLAALHAQPSLLSISSSDCLSLAALKGRVTVDGACRGRLVAVAPPGSASAQNGPSAGTPAPSPPPADSGSEIIVSAPRIKIRTDPLAPMNMKSYALVQDMDGAVVKPVALAYQHGLPTPLRDGLHNFLGNLHQPDVAINYLLQLKPGKAAETAGRFLINSTLGLAGLFDIAKRKPFDLPDRPNGFADTLGYYGVKPGAFLYLPLIGPTTVRDLAGLGIDRLLLPVAVGAPFTKASYNIPTGIIKALDHRVRFEQQFSDQAKSESPYVAMRSYYLASREKEIAALHTHRKHHRDHDRCSHADQAVSSQSTVKVSCHPPDKLPHMPAIEPFPM